MRVLDGGDELAQVGLHAVRVARRPVEQVVELELVILGRAQGAHGQLGAVARMDAEAPGHAHVGARVAAARPLGDVLPDHRRDGARAVAQDQPQELAAVSPGAALTLADEQDLIDLLAVGELAHEHGRRTLEPVSDKTKTA